MLIVGRFLPSLIHSALYNIGAIEARYVELLHHPITLWMVCCHSELGKSKGCTYSSDHDAFKMCKLVGVQDFRDTKS